MAIKQYRVDFRMLHGQVVTAYGRQMGVDEFIVVNEEVSKDEFQKSLLEMAALTSTVRVLSPKEAKEVIEAGDFKGRNTLVVFKEIEDVVEITDLGLKIDSVQIGGMFSKKGRDRKKYDVALFADDIDKKAFRDLEDKGIELSFQVVPDYKAKSLHSMIDY